MKSRSINEAYIVTNQSDDEEEKIQTENMLNSIRLKKKSKEKNLEGEPRPTSEGPAN